MSVGGGENEHKPTGVFCSRRFDGGLRVWKLWFWDSSMVSFEGQSKSCSLKKFLRVWQMLQDNAMFVSGAT